VPRDLGTFGCRRMILSAQYRPAPGPAQAPAVRGRCGRVRGHPPPCG